MYEELYNNIYEHSQRQIYGDLCNNMCGHSQRQIYGELYQEYVNILI